MHGIIRLLNDNIFEPLIPERTATLVCPIVSFCKSSFNVLHYPRNRFSIFYRLNYKMKMVVHNLKSDQLESIFILGHV